MRPAVSITTWKDRKTERLLNRADKIEGQAIERALALVEQRARKILQEQPLFEEFVMGMGHWFFITAQEEIVDWNEEYMCEKVKTVLLPVYQVISQYDDRLKLTGYSMRFTAISEICYKW